MNYLFCIFLFIFLILIIYSKCLSIETFKVEIPKKIYMCHRKLDKIKIHSENWKKLNPDFEIELFDDSLCRDFLKKEFSQIHLNLFDFIRDGPIKADFWRVCIIYKRGGYYVDADIQPIRPLSEYIDEKDKFVSCISNNFQYNRKEWVLNPHFIVTYKGNSILKDCIDSYLNYYINKVPYSYWGWSICKLLILPFPIKKKKSQIIIYKKERYKFLLELPTMNDCEYNDVIVLRNRYSHYKNHNFL